ncbi:lyase family protein [Rhodobacteraceae bacterium KMM 6894]|nr:lyase family protein [Rhodobacteraceae bacterium KMM 6894]
MSYRIETDSLGDVQLPEKALLGSNTARGVENFTGMGPAISSYPHFMRAMALVKRAAAMANRDVGALSPDVADAIIIACDEVAAGEHIEQFPTYLMEGSGGTSTNMNFNEVIANRAGQMLGDALGVYARVTPNDHVNRSQSTNDVLPTAIKLACILAHPSLATSVQSLIDALRTKASETQDMLRTGRTCMQAAQPMTWGQYFSGHASALSRALNAVQSSVDAMRIVPMGGTAIGTGLGAAPGYVTAIAPALTQAFGFEIKLAEDPFDAMHSADGFVRLSAELRNLSATMAKLAADLIVLGSDGASGLGELRLPAVQPGSSIMAGKVNPVIPMMVQQVWMRVHGHDAAVAIAAQSGQMEINHFEPVMALSLFEQMDLISAAAEGFAARCVAGIDVDEVRSYANLAQSFGVSTIFLQELGYKRVATMAKRAVSEGRSLADIAVDESYLTQADMRNVLIRAAVSAR